LRGSELQELLFMFQYSFPRSIRKKWTAFEISQRILYPRHSVEWDHYFPPFVSQTRKVNILDKIRNYINQSSDPTIQKGPYWEYKQLTQQKTGTIFTAEDHKRLIAVDQGNHPSLQAHLVKRKHFHLRFLKLETLTTRLLILAI
jgi:hypothetical protein